VTPCYLSAAAPSVPEAVAAARAAGQPVRIACYLLAPGFFAGTLGQHGADTLSAPLAPDPLLAELVLRRYDHALRTEADR
jgi:hypothetical protein